MLSLKYSWNQLVPAGPVTKTEKRRGPDRTVTNCNWTSGYGLSYSKIERLVKDRFLPILLYIFIDLKISFRTHPKS